MKLQAVGENALMLYLGEHATDAASALVQTVVAGIETALGNDLIDLVPSYASIMILYDPLRSDHRSTARRVRQALQQLSSSAVATGRTVVLPVYYGPEVGADLEALAERAGLSVAEVIELHSSTEYRVYAIGFAPGFAYLGEVDERIATPRLPTPRVRVPRGSVAIAERQTAVYPSESPGGWNLIGCCPVSMFDLHKQPSMPVAIGDSVRFAAIGRARFLALGGELA